MKTGEFCIQIDFLKGSESPARVFRAMSGLIESFQALDRQLIKSFDVKIDPVLLLEDIESGSIKAWLRSILIELDDGDIKNLNWKAAIGTYLVKAKYLLIDFTSERTQISDRAELKSLQEKILLAAEETSVNKIPAYTPLSLPAMISSINSLSRSLAPLNTGDSAQYITKDTITKFNLEWSVSPESMERLLTKETISNEAVMILKVKRPDYLGDAMWDFRYETRPIPARILDNIWLSKFQSRSVDVRPGDALRADVRIDVEYGYDGEVVATHYSVMHVHGVVLEDETRQMHILPSSPSETP